MADARQPGGVRCVIVTPESTVLDTQARFVAVPLFDGQRGVGHGHAPFIGRLGAGEVRITEGGFVEVGHDTVTVITQRAIPAERLDAGAARAELEKLAATTATGDEAITAKLRAQESARALARTATR